MPSGTVLPSGRITPPPALVPPQPKIWVPSSVRAPLLSRYWQLGVAIASGAWATRWLMNWLDGGQCGLVLSSTLSYGPRRSRGCKSRVVANCGSPTPEVGRKQEPSVGLRSSRAGARVAAPLTTNASPPWIS
jgi:hypothetical protein